MGCRTYKGPVEEKSKITYEFLKRPTLRDPIVQTDIIMIVPHPTNKND